MKTTNKTIKRILSLALCLALVMSYVPMVSVRTGAAVSDLTVTIDTGASVTLKDTDGDNFYEMGTADELYAFAAAINAGNTNINVELTANINLNSGYTFNSDGTVTYDGATVTSGYVSWSPIGNADNVYAGVLDGANKTISGLYFNGSAEYVGFFAYMGGTIKNLNLTNAYFENSVSTSQTKAYVGGFSAYSTGNFNNCRFNGTVLNEVCYVAYAGGISAYSQGGFVDCVNNGTITANTTDQSGRVGGIVGESNGSITDCLNNGVISGVIETYGYFGGIVGEAYGEILNSTNTGVVSGNTDSSSRVGGIAGFVSTEVLVDRCTNTADLNAESRGYARVAGIAGESYGTVTNCSNFGNMTASAGTFSYYVAEPAGIVGCTTGGSISFCYSVGFMTAKRGSQKYPAGIVGRIYSDTVLTSNFYCLDGAFVGVGYNDTTELGGDVSGKAEGKTLEQFNSGEVAYHLQQGELSSTGNITPVWGQNVDGEGEIQSYPVWNGAIVYGSSPCPVLYSNYDGVVKNHEEYSTPCDDTCVCGYVRTDAQAHDYVNGVCSMCSEFNPDNIKDGVYLISTGEQLVYFAQQVNSGNNAISAKLLNDITVNANVLADDGSLNSGTFIQWTPIGYKNSDEDYINYTGVFDGQNHTIRGLYCNLDKGFVGLFGRVAENGIVRNLTVADSYFYGTECVGGIAGYVRDSGSIINCHNFSTVKSDEEVGGVVGYINSTAVVISGCSNSGYLSCPGNNAGGICGYAYNATIENCFNTADISDDLISGAGGICGEQSGGEIRKCYNVGNIYCVSCCGGIVAFNDRNAVIIDCYNLGDIICSGYGLGGIAGTGYNIKNCFSAGTISGYKQNIGGIVGENRGNVKNCYYLTGSAKDYAGVAQYGTGNSKADTQTPDTEGSTTGVSLNQFASGEIAYLLDQSNTVQIWGQDIDNNKPVQAYPNFTGYKVYRDATDGYTNLLPLTENAEGYYEIDSFCDLVWFSNNINNGNIPRNTNAILTADIDMQGVSWTPICSTGLYYNTTEYTDKGYEGIFDGNGFVIKNLALKGTNGVNCTVGLFGTLSGTVKNLGMDGVTFDLNGATDVRAAGIAGQMLDGSLIENCYVVNSNLTPGLYIVGGVAGCNYAGIIRNCFTKNVTISANERCGNLVSDCRGDINGTDRIGTVENCWTDAGRVVGTQSVAEYIIDCHTASGDMFEKGMVAYNLGDAWGQNLDSSEDNQGHPVINGAKVYFNGYNGCPEYSNSESTIEHNFVNGICSGCSLYEAAVVVSESNYEDLELSADYVGYYAVANAGQLLWYSKNHGDIVNLVLVEDFEIGKDIKWMPLSNSVKIFDGAGHTITIEQDHTDTEISSNYGLFSELNVGTIKNVILNGSIKIKTSGNVGALSGSMYESAIENVISYVDITNLGTGNTGGLSGYYGGRDPSVINNCAVYADISGGGNAGGIIGSGWGGTRFYRIYNTAVVGTVSGTTAGALVGYSATGNSGGSFYPSSVRFENIYYNVGDSDILTVGAWATNGGVSCETMAKFVSVEAKTAEQFASGEVAYLLQQGNTEQVWGQMSNTEGSLPMLSDNELYKVATVAETGNYSVANIGDTTNDGIVDVNDYQALINTILADDHEQIEAASYDDIIRYDLDGDGYLDVIDASLMHNFINGFITVDVYAVGDYDCNGKAFEEIDLKTIKHAIEKSTKLSTTEKYLCDINKDGKFDSLDISFLEETYGEIENISCEDNLKTTYSWANDYSTCTATAKCSLCGKIIAVETVTTEYYYEESEWEIYTSYTARFENEFFEEKNVEFWEYKNNDETTTEFIGGDDGFLDW